MPTTLILNVDDVPTHRYAKTRLLKHANYAVVEAGTGAEALRLVDELKPDLVLLDVNLPDMSGLEVCRTIKSSTFGKRIPVVHVTATFVGDENESISLEHGADVYLAEPLEPQTLLTVVGVLLRLRKTEAGLAQSEERMRLATEAAGIATWEMRLDTHTAVWSRELYRMLGYNPDKVKPDWPSWQARIHPDDLERVVAAMRNAQRDGELFREEHRIIRADDSSERHVAPFAKLHSDERGVRNRFLGVLVDVTERKKAESEREYLLREANAARAEAEQASRLKDNFLASLSHELRTPMHAMLGWLRLLRTGSLNERERRAAIETIERNARLQSELINELLDVSRAASGKLEVDMRNVDLKEVLDAAIDSVRPLAEAKRIELKQTLQECARTIAADPGRLQQIFGNLLSNAVKFTPIGGHVRVDCVSRGALVEISVVDDGEGIEPELLPHVFEAFRQADGSITRRHGGLGLGLSIVQRLVDLHGGSVRAESAGPGLGSTFTVLLPIAGASEALFPAAMSEDRTDRGTRLRGVKVLAVDDNEDMLSLMKEMLRWEGATVTTAATAADAYNAAGEQPPDILILDIGMPDEHGYDLLQRLRKAGAARTHRLPAIAVTGYASVEDATRALAAGFQAHLAKPFEMEELFSLVEALAPPPTQRSG